MALFEIPTGILPEVHLDELPAEGEEGKVYRIIIDPTSDWELTNDYVWFEGEWHHFSFDEKIFGAYFQKYQESVQEVITGLEARIEELEGGSKVLFEGVNIELTEAGATIGKTLSVVSNIKVSDGTVFNVTLSDMTIDEEPIEDVSGEIVAYGLADWDWQGGELYSDVFGNGAYFAFGTKPMDAVASQVTLGFVNEGESFESRTLVIGKIKVEVA